MGAVWKIPALCLIFSTLPPCAFQKITLLPTQDRQTRTGDECGGVAEIGWSRCCCCLTRFLSLKEREGQGAWNVFVPTRTLLHILNLPTLEKAGEQR